MKNIVILLTLCSLIGCASSPSARVVREYYPSGVIKKVSSLERGQMNGISRQYSPDGILQCAQEYKNNQLHGFVNHYSSEGYLWKKEVYEHGRLIEVQKFDADGQLIPEDYSCCQ